jgi:hypothetical protein
VKINIECTIFDMFPTFVRCPSNETQANKILFVNYLGTLQKQFSLYFKDVNVSKSE